MPLAKREEVCDRLIVAFSTCFAEHLRFFVERLAEFFDFTFGSTVHGERHDLLNLS